MRWMNLDLESCNTVLDQSVAEVEEVDYGAQDDKDEGQDKHDE